MSTQYKIHPAIGIARVGNSEEFYVGPETVAGLPRNPDGQPFRGSDFRDKEGKLKRQAARFQVYRYEGPDDAGRPVTLRDSDIQEIIWTVHVANKKASWYEFRTWQGEEGYAPNHPLRNADVTGEARRKLIIDPGPRRLSGPHQRRHFARDSSPEELEIRDYPVSFPPEHLEPYRINTLGEALTDGEGNLLVLGGYGHSGSTQKRPEIQQYANNDGWFDDTSDGPVRATIVLKDGTTFHAEPAWVLTTPPAYAPQILNMVTLYDTIYDVFVREGGLRPDIYKEGLWNRDYAPSFPDEIAPLLQRPLMYNWVVNIPNHPHEFRLDVLGDPDPRYDSLRRYYLQLIRPPEMANVFAAKNGAPLMPYLAGDGALQAPEDISRYLVLTDTQYFLLQQWAAGRFHREPLPPPRRAGEALDRAVLENCVGGPFSPGIEMTWISRNRRIYAAPFRLKAREHLGHSGLSLGEDFAAGLEPGDVTRYMAVPWQADFNECSSQPIQDGANTNVLWWWPAQRPLMVFTRPEPPRQHVPWVGQFVKPNGDDYLTFAQDIDMVHAWKELGFVFNIGDEQRPNFIEVERRLAREGGSGSGGR